MDPITITIVTTETATSVQTPYSPAFAPQAKRLGGRWNAMNRCWTFNPREEQKIRDLCISIWGTDGSNCETVDLRVDAATWWRADTVGGMQTCYLAGRQIMYRPARDSHVHLGDGVILLEGTLPSRGGSVKNPSIGIDDSDGVILEVRGIPSSHPDVRGPGVEVISPEEDRRAALVSERERLLARLTEIDAILA